MRKMRRNEFQARPTDFAGGVTMGVSQYPGFHTATGEETTYAYAQQKAVSGILAGALADLTAEDVPSVRLEDYPVVVALDMAGLSPRIDYDAVHFVQPQLWDLAENIIAEAAREDISPLTALDDYVEYGEQEPAPMPDDVTDHLYQFGAAVMSDPSGALRAFAEEQDDPNAFLIRLANRQLPDEALADITGQFRYTEDVSSERVVSVAYLRPWWPRMFDWERFEHDCRGPHRVPRHHLLERHLRRPVARAA
ncbi:MAG: hypothetical protein JRD89_02260 [Deltaproteobacteria bacterium]|nr:hypothetical protein [Deltaproteobacteria bacterium]